MVGLDTNVLVRYLAQDDARQAASATRLIERELSSANPGFISVVVIAELCWVLSRLYGATAHELASTIQDLLDTPQFHVEQRDVLQATLRRFKAANSRKAGIVDMLITELASSAGCARTMTFDKAAVRTAGMTILT